MALPPPSGDSTCLVTGASSGIGAEIARQLAERGHGVTLVARRADRLRELAAEISKKHGVRAETIAADLSDPLDRTRLVDQIAEMGLEVEVLVNNAGFGSGGRFHELDLDTELRMVRTNVEAIVDLCGRYVPGMIERGRGAVLNVASTAAFQPIPRQATYCGTKAFVLAFTDSLHQELRGTGVSATALCPGPVRTEFVEVAEMGEVESTTPSFLWMSAEECARIAIRGMERGRRVVVPGALNRLTAVSGHYTPRSVLLPAIDRLWPIGK
jgi:short-subunit dehydrogenase